MKKNKYFYIVSILISVGMIFPVVSWLLFLGVPSVTPAKVRQSMAEEAILIDVRPESEYRELSLKQAVNVPLDKISHEQKQSWKGMLNGKKHILLICDSGIMGALATKKMHQLGYKQALNVQGGFDAWLASAEFGSDSEIIIVKTPEGEKEAVRRREYTIFEQAVICNAAFFLKPLYEIISLILAIMLWKNTEPELAALRRAMIAFFLGENACAANYLFFGEQSILMEFFHMYGMLVCFSLAGFALMKAIDIRIVKFSEKEAKCALLPLCKKCYKYQDVSCNIRMLFLFIIPATAMLGFMPLTAELGSYFYVSRIFGDDVVFGHSIILQLFEIRLCPLAALIFLVLSFIVLYYQKEKGIETSKILFAVGLGPLCFSLMRFLLYWGYSENPLWADSWEELTEFLFIAFVLWIIIVPKSMAKYSRN
ncbi:MAG: rhodanese-like domain-containing protein [Desulfobacterales bacterium]|nr:rhodanese-like domain-containing protein [Desulfobacterales bacterium]